MVLVAAVSVSGFNRRYRVEVRFAGMIHGRSNNLNDNESEMQNVLFQLHTAILNNFLYSYGRHIGKFIGIGCASMM